MGTSSNQRSRLGYWASISVLLPILLGVFFYHGFTGESREPSPPEAVKLGSGRMFDSVAPAYDLMNRLMSLGLDQQWRRFLVESLKLRDGDRVLDLATGTADVAILHAQYMESKKLSGSVVGIDPSQGMLGVARQKVDALGLKGRIELLQGDAQHLEGLPSGSFDKVSMSFGIRNVEDRVAALREVARVVRPSNETIVGILEFTVPASGPLHGFAHFMVKYGAPLLGRLLTGLKEEYMHLQRSILEFPSPADFAALMDSAGLHVFDVKETGFGAVVLYLARPAIVRQTKA